MVEGVNVHAFDSKLAAMIEGCYVLRAIEMIEEGYEPQQIIDDLTNMREHTGAYLIVDDLRIYKKWSNYWCSSMGWNIIENEASSKV